MKFKSLSPAPEILRFFTETAWASSTKKPGLENMIAISKRLGNPEKKFRSIHIGGTNGKGSVSLKIAKALEYSHFRCGLFTSPHIHCFTERIQIGSEFISEEETHLFLSEIIEISHREKLPLTYFEFCTLLAFQYFAAKKVDCAVIEVGLGGRLDATNIITPLVSVITSISEDHCEYLGDSEEKIAQEKAGIIKPFTPVIIGPRTPAHIFKMKAISLQAPLIQAEGEAAHYGIENQLIAKKAIELLQNHFEITKAACAAALHIEPQCRFEVVSKEKLQEANLSCQGNIVLDVAHNKDGILHLIQRLQTAFPQKRFHFMLNFSANKNIEGCLELILTVAKTIHILEVNHPRLLSASQLIERLGILEIPIKSGSPAALLHDFLPTMDTQDVLVLCGSFFIMKEVRTQLGYFNSAKVGLLRRSS